MCPHSKDKVLYYFIFKYIMNTSVIKVITEYNIRCFCSMCYIGGICEWPLYNTYLLYMGHRYTIPIVYYIRKPFLFVCLFLIIV